MSRYWLNCIWRPSYGGHLGNVKSDKINKYLAAFLDPKNLILDTKIIIISYVYAKIWT